MGNLLCEANVSEGRDLKKVEAIRTAMMANVDINLMQVVPDTDHNRTVFIFKGSTEGVLKAAEQMAAKALELIDMSKHAGAHPRIGAVDVVPFIPINGTTTKEALETAQKFGKFLGNLGVPVYYYEDAATSPERKLLTFHRKGQYEGLEEKMKNNGFVPDEGPNQFNPKSGATVTGVRFPLVALNVNLNTHDIEIGRSIVKAIRATTGGYINVRSIALTLKNKHQVQVSINLVQYEKTPIHRVFETVKSEAQSYGVEIVSSELVGNVPLEALEKVVQFYLRAHDFSVAQVY